jgi:hypothetical protein
MSYAHLIKMLIDGTRTCEELAEETGLHKHTVYEYTRELHKVKAVHIACWEKDRLGRDCMPIFMIGNKPDVKRHRFSAAERQATYRSRKNLTKTTTLSNWLQ